MHSPRLWVLYGLQELVQLVSSSGAEDLLPVNIVTHMRQIVVPMHWYTSDAVGSLEREIIFVQRMQQVETRSNGFRTSSVEESES